MNFGTKGCMYCDGECNKECLSQEESKQETLEERINHIAFLHKQNLNGRETEDELFEAGILAGIEETEERMFELHDKWEKYTKDNYHPDFSSMSFKSYVENFNNKKL
jgi:hypothetical protein